MNVFANKLRAQAAASCMQPLRPRALAVAVAIGVGAGQAGAATFTVTSAADVGPGSLRDAISTANQIPGPDNIEFAPGLGEIVLQSEIEVFETLGIDGPIGGQTIRGSGSSRLFVVPISGADVTLQNLLLTGGRTTDIGGPGCSSFGNGGAVCSLANLTLVGTTIADSGTFGDGASGGGVYAVGAVTLENSTVTGNFTSDGPARGGGISVNGLLSMSDSTISANSTAGGNASGGGVWVGDGAQIDNSVISGNSTSGASAYGGGFAGTGSFDLENSSVVGNSTSGAGAEGGGLRLSSTSQIVNSTISGNTTAAINAPGAGVLIVGADLAVVNSTISENTSQVGAGGLEAATQSIQAYLVQLESSILAGNTGAEGNFRATVGPGTIDVNVIESLFGDAQSEVTGVRTGTVFSNSPGLGPLGDNGCETPAGAPSVAACVQTHLPGTDSPAINRGSNPLALGFDQRGPGFPRTRAGATDIGAVEAEVPPAQPVPADLRVGKSDGDVVAAPGEVLTWQIDFANIGELSAQGVTLIETVPDSTTFNPSLSGDWICEEDGVAGSQCLFEIGELPAGASGTASFSVIVDGDLSSTASLTAIANTVEITGADTGGLDPNPANNVAVKVTPVSSLGKLRAPGRSGSAADGFLGGFGNPNGSAVAPRLGAAAAAIGDLDGDGRADVAVSAPGADALLLVLGSPFQGDSFALSEFPSTEFPGYLIQADDGLIGLSDRVAGIGDVNGDGLDGLVYTDNAIDFSPLTGPVRGAFVQPGFDTPPGFVADQGGRFSPNDNIELVSRQAFGPFATSVAGLGDINADGLDDFALSFLFGIPPFQFETVFVLFGDPGLVAFQPDILAVEDASAANGLRVTNSSATRSGFGASISGIGDFNGDGVEDFAISAPAQLNGAVFVILGSSSLAESSEGFVDTELLDGNNGFVVFGGDDAAAFGSRIVGVGDFDGDGFDDMLISEQRPAGQPGRVHIVFGTDADLPPEVVLEADGALRFSRVPGLTANDDFGLASAGPGDLDGDGLDDIAIGAPGLAEVFDGQAPTPDTGRVLVLSGTAEPPMEIQIAGLDPAQGYWLTAPSPGIRFGAAVAGPGDFDGDGVPDLLVTAPETPFEGVSGAGQFWIISGAVRPEPPGPTEPLEPTILSLTGSLSGLPFFDDRFVEVAVDNTGTESADSIELDLEAPPGYEAIGVFRLAGSCNADSAGNVACDADSIPDWQCAPAAGGFACQLETLPVEATAAVLLQLRGDGAGQVEAGVSAANAAPVAINIPVTD